MDEQDQTLQQFLDSANIAEHLKEDELNKIGNRIVEEFEVDLASRRQWEEKNEEWMKLATSVVEKKTFPWPGAANVKYPLLATAALQFAARAYPALVPGNSLVKGVVTGFDPDNQLADSAQRIGMHMSYQILQQMPDWEEDMDKLCLTLPITGCAFKKTYFDSNRGSNVSELVLAKNLVVNYFAKSLETASRKTHVVYLYPNEVLERQRAGIFLDKVELGESAYTPQDSTSDTMMGTRYVGQDRDTPFEILECHCYWDLDKDDYKEPYIVTVERHTRKVLRITARYEHEGIKKNKKGQIVKIEPIEYFTKFSFIPNPDGGFYDLGFGLLLGAINETANTTINQLLDAGTLNNMQAGFLSRGIRIKSGSTQFKPGEWKPVNATGDDLKRGIFPLPTKEPSNVLLELLAKMVESGKELSSIAEIFTGKMPGQNTPATTTMTAVEQGLKVFTAIHKRVYRALGKEYEKLYRLNKIYLDEKEYFTILDTGESQQIWRFDYEQGGINVRPAADPNVVSEGQKLLKAQGLLELMQTGQLNPQEVVKRVLEAQQQEGIDKLMQTQQQPNPEMLKLQLEQQKHQDEMAYKWADLHIRAATAEAQVMTAKATAILNMANAQKVDQQMNLDQADQEMDHWMQMDDAVRSHIDLAFNQEQQQAQMQQQGQQQDQQNQQQQQQMQQDQQSQMLDQQHQMAMQQGQQDHEANMQDLQQQHEQGLAQLQTQAQQAIAKQKGGQGSPS